MSEWERPEVYGDKLKEWLRWREEPKPLLNLINYRSTITDAVPTTTYIAAAFSGILDFSQLKVTAIPTKGGSHTVGFMKQSKNNNSVVISSSKVAGVDPDFVGVEINYKGNTYVLMNKPACADFTAKLCCGNTWQAESKDNGTVDFYITIDKHTALDYYGVFYSDGLKSEWFTPTTTFPAYGINKISLKPTNSNTLIAGDYEFVLRIGTCDGIKDIPFKLHVNAPAGCRYLSLPEGQSMPLNYSLPATGGTISILLEGETPIRLAKDYFDIQNWNTEPTFATPTIEDLGDYKAKITIAISNKLTDGNSKGKTCFSFALTNKCCGSADDNFVVTVNVEFSEQDCVKIQLT